MADLKKQTKDGKLRFAAALLLVFVAASSIARAKESKTAHPAKAAENHKYKIATGADQVLSAVYDSTTNSLRVSGGGNGGGTVTNVGLSMPSTFSVSGGPITSSGTFLVNWAQPVGIANGGTGQTNAAAAFNALAPSTVAGGLIYGTGTNSYGNLSLGAAGQCLGSNGTTLLWTACSSGSALTLSGDLSGTSASQTVIGLQGHAISATAPASGQVLEWNSSANAWTPSALPAFGSVSSVGLAMPSMFNLTGSPITGAGTLSVSLAPEAANTVLAGPASGASAAPTFRALTALDLPSINLAATGNGGVSGTLAVANGGTGLTSVGSSGQCLESSGTAMTWSNCAAGTVTSVGLTMPSGFGVSGSPITAAGSFGISMPTGWGAGTLLMGNGANSAAALAPGASGQCLTSTGASLAWGPCGSASASTVFQVNGASASSQTPINFQSGGYITVSNPSAGNVQFNFTGPLGVVNGGTGMTGMGSPGQCLQVNAGGTALIYAACGTSGGAGTVTSVGLAGTANEISVSGTSPITTSGTLTLSIPNNPVLPGTTTGTFSGNLTGNVAGNLTGNVTGNVSGSAATITGALSLANTPLTTNQDILFDNAGALGRLPISTVTSGQCLGNNGGVWGSFACSGGSGSGLPSSWTVGSNNAVTVAPTASTDTTPLTVASALSSGGTADIFDVCQTAPCTTTNKYFWVTWNGNLGFQASNLQLSTSGPAPYLYLNGINGSPGQPYLKLATASLNTPACAASSAATGGTVAAGTYYFKCTWVNAAGESYTSAETSVTTTGSTSTITLTAPGIQYSAFGYQIYEGASSGNEHLLVPTSSICALSSQQFDLNNVCALTANATFTATPAGGSQAPPSTNSTGGAYITGLAPSAEGPGVFLASGAPGADAPVDSGLMLPGGTGINLTSGSTTTAQTLACLSASNTVSQCGANAANTIIGVFQSSGASSLVQTTGVATISLASTATTTYNDFACSNATAGTIVDNGTTPCASGQQVGIIAQTNGTAVISVPVFLRFAGSSGGSGGSGTVTSIATSGPITGGPITTTGTIGCPTCLLTNPAAAQTITPANSSTEGLVIASNGGTTTNAFDVQQNGWDSIKVNGYGQVFLSHTPAVDGLEFDFNQTGANLNFGSTKDHINFQQTGNGDIHGQIVVSAAASASYTFALPYANPPVCVLTPTSNPGSLTWWVTATNTAVTANLSASGTVTFNYVCVGNPN